MKKINTALFIIFLVIFTALLAVLLLFPDKAYDKLSNSLSEEKSHTVTLDKKKLTGAAKQNHTPPSLPAPEVINGFDWRLPDYAKRSNLSGLVSEVHGNSEYIRTDFHMVRWDTTNPQQGKFDFSELENNIRKRPQQQVLLRLENYGKCESPDWAIQKLQVTSRGTLVFWDDQYLEVIRPYIKEVSKLTKRYPQIIGIQIGVSDGQYRGDCSKFHLKDGWGEFNLKPDELKEAQGKFGFTPEKLEHYTKKIIDLYADAFQENSSKLVFNNFDQFSWTEIAAPYNRRMPAIAKHALNRGIGNRDGQIEHWMRYTQTVYGMGVTPSSNGTCTLDMNEQFAKNNANRYWGTENEEFGDYYWVTDYYGSIDNQPHRFFTSSLRALQMRRNYMTLHGGAMQKLKDPIYKTQDFLRYLDKTLGKQMVNTPDAFILLGERYVANFRLEEFPQIKQCQSQGGTAFRSFGRWISEKSDSQPAMRIDLPISNKRWGQGFYLPDKVNYEYAARSSNKFSFELDNELSKTRCSNGCNIEVKVSYKDEQTSEVWLETQDGRTSSFKTKGDGRIKTATFTVHTKFGSGKPNILLKSNSAPLSVIMLRINFLNP